MAHYLELSFELGEIDIETAEAACTASGALAVTFSATRDEAVDAVLEPAPGELRLWRNTRVQALFSAERAGGALSALIVEVAVRLAVPAALLAARAVADRAWEREWLRDFHAMRFGERLWICPRHEQVTARDAVVVRLDPGLAFGTGTHPSTSLCLEWLDDTARRQGSTRFGQLSVVDYGCGSGVLGLAALLLGAQRVYAFDIDPQARLATRQNAEDNGVADRLLVCERAEDIPQGCALLIANILGSVLRALSGNFAALLPTGAQLLLSGILAAEHAEVAMAFAKWFDMRQFAERDGWVALSGTRY